MKQVTTYGIKIHTESYKPIQQSISIYRNVISYLISVCLEEWDELLLKQDLKRKKTFVEMLIHHTENRPTVKYENFDSLFYKLPSYLRRSAIAEAIGKVSSYKSSLKRWENDKKGKEPGYPVAGHTFPVLYKDNMYEPDGPYSARIKVWIRNTWDWINVTYRKSDADYIARHCSDRKQCSPTIMKKGKQWFLMFPFEEVVFLREVEPIDQTILAVDLGINNACACAVMKSDGTVIGRRMFRMPVEEDSLTHKLNKIKKQQAAGHRHSPTLWATASGINQRIAEETARFIERVAIEFDVDTVVFEHLETSGKKKGKSKRQRLHMWKCRGVQSMVATKVHRHGMRISRVCAWNTSVLAFDGSGKVTRNIDNNYSLCKFQNKKIYNCDLNAAYNIGARFFIRGILKSLPETVRSGISAKVPECTKRSTCTLSTLISLNAGLSVLSL